jgi:Tol biopolymer transport system component
LKYAFTKAHIDLNIWRVNADGSGGAAPLIDSEFNDSTPNFSPDGRRILFQSSRTGASDIWVCDANGSEAVRLTDSRGSPIGAAKWSPDGQQIAFDWRPSGKSEAYIMASDGGNVRALVKDSNQNGAPAWSHNGRSIYFVSNRSGRSEIWKMGVQGGPAVPVTKQGGTAPQESPDGKFLYYFRDTDVWRVPVADAAPSGPESKIAAPVLTGGDWGNWAPANDGLYYIRRKNNGGATIEFFDFARQTVRIVYEMPKPPAFGGCGLALSPDAKVLLFVELDRDDSSIFVE